MPWEKRFDRQKALHEAVETLWAGGYEATSMTSLLHGMGIQKGSFYSTFGSKHEVLMEALRDYTRDRLEEFEALHRAPSPRAALESHLREVATQAGTPAGRRGCFVVNTTLEMAQRDADVRAMAQQNMRQHEGHYVRLLEAARERGELAPQIDVQAVARGLMSMVLGMRVLARASVPRAVLDGVRDAALSLLGPPG